MLPNDFKNFRAEDYDDSFQLVEPRTAAIVLFCLLMWGAVFERFM